MKNSIIIFWWLFNKVFMFWMQGNNTILYRIPLLFLFIQEFSMHDIKKLFMIWICKLTKLVILRYLLNKSYECIININTKHYICIYPFFHYHLNILYTFIKRIEKEREWAILKRLIGSLNKRYLNCMLLSYIFHAHTRVVKTKCFRIKICRIWHRRKEYDSCIHEA